MNIHVHILNTNIEWYVYTVLDRPSSQIPSFEINIRKIYNHKFELKFQVQLNLSNKTSQIV